MDESTEQVELRLSGLVVKSNAILQVYNRIYESVFDWNWVEKELSKLRPYADALTAWFDSNCLDESRLLRGQALEDATARAKGKSLGDRDILTLVKSLSSIHGKNFKHLHIPDFVKVVGDLVFSRILHGLLYN